MKNMRYLVSSDNPAAVSMANKMIQAPESCCAIFCTKEELDALSSGEVMMHPIVENLESESK